MGQNDNRPKTYARGSQDRSFFGYASDDLLRCAKRVPRGTQGSLIKLYRLLRVCNFFENLESRSEGKNLTKIESVRSVESV